MGHCGPSCVVQARLGHGGVVIIVVFELSESYVVVTFTHLAHFSYSCLSDDNKCVRLLFFFLCSCAELEMVIDDRRQGRIFILLVACVCVLE